MKKSPQPISFSPLGRILQAFLEGSLHQVSLRLLVALLGGLLPAALRTAAAENGDAYEITVRTSVDRPFTLFGKKPVALHSKLYAIGGIRAACLMPHDTSPPLAIPVNEDILRAQLKAVLAAHGFHEITWGKTPDIVLTIIYGRDRMRNPYADKTIEVDGSVIGLPGGKVVEANSSENEIGREKSDPAYYQKLQKADAEKLFVVINAWENPGFGPKEKEKPVLLWRTLVFVDDPGRDLNLISERMLAAAGGYFDRPIDKEEVSVMSNAPDGIVAMGTPVEVPSPKPGG